MTWKCSAPVKSLDALKWMGGASKPMTDIVSSLNEFTCHVFLLDQTPWNTGSCLCCEKTSRFYFYWSISAHMVGICFSMCWCICIYTWVDTPLWATRDPLYVKSAAQVSIGNPEKMEPITNVSQIPSNRWALICCLCKEKTGACIQVESPLTFHSLNAGTQRRLMRCGKQSVSQRDAEISSV